MDFKRFFIKYKSRLLFTLTLILTETVLGLLFPLFIGNAIGDALKSVYIGTFWLGILGLSLIIVGSTRRLLDSRFYARIYTEASIDTVENMKGRDTSVKSARLNMLGEMIEFAENQIPDIIGHSINLIGVTLIIILLNIKIFVLSLATCLVIFIIYLLSSKKTILLNSRINNQMESQVNVLNKKSKTALLKHLQGLMKWNIKLSDVETINYSLSWIVMIALLLLSIIISTADKNIQYGALFSLIMYVYQFIESVASLPLYYQQWLRLNEIISRLKTI